MLSFLLKFTLVWNSALPFWKLLVSEFLLGIPETLHCSTSAPHVKIVPLLDVHQLLMSAGTLTYSEQILSWVPSSCPTWHSAYKWRVSLQILPNSSFIILLSHMTICKLFAASINKQETISSLALYKRCVEFEFCHVYHSEPIIVAAPSKERTVFALSTTGIVGSNPTQSMVICARLFCLCCPVYR
jgi:hypothetical protein